jgi:hypothetical protein
MKRFILRISRQLWVEFEIRKILPSRIGRYRVVDMLQAMEDRN